MNVFQDTVNSWHGIACSILVCVCGTLLPFPSSVMTTETCGHGECDYDDSCRYGNPGMRVLPSFDDPRVLPSFDAPRALVLPTIDVPVKVRVIPSLDAPRCIPSLDDPRVLPSFDIPAPRRHVDDSRTVDVPYVSPLPVMGQRAFTVTTERLGIDMEWDDMSFNEDEDEFDMSFNADDEFSF